jgi:PAS domain S-box-containing protein
VRAALLEGALTTLLPVGGAPPALAGLLERVAADFGARAALTVRPGSAWPVGEDAVHPPEARDDLMLMAQVRSAWAAHGSHALATGHAVQVRLDSGSGPVSLLVAPAEPAAGRQPCALAVIGEGAQWKAGARSTLKALASLVAILPLPARPAVHDLGQQARPGPAQPAAAQPASTQPGESPADRDAPGKSFPGDDLRPGLRLVRPDRRRRSGTAGAGTSHRNGNAAVSGADAGSGDRSRGRARDQERPPSWPALTPGGPTSPAEGDALARALVAGAPAAIVAVDSARRIREFNPAAEDLFGRARAEVLGLDMPETLVPETFRQPFVDAMVGFLATGDRSGVTRKVLLRALRADGSERPVELTPMPVRLGSQTYFFGFLRDASELENATMAVAEGDARFRLLSDLVPVGIVQTDLEGRCRFVNDKWCEMSGVTAGEVLGENWRTTINEDDVLRIDEMRDRGGGGTTELATDCRLKTAAGGEVWVHVVVRRVLDQRGNLVGRVAALTDVHSRKRTEAAIQASRRQLAEQNVELRDLNETRVRYLATVSHELRTPLTSIVSFSELIRAEAPGLGAEPGEYLDIIQRNAERLLRIVADLLDLSSLEEGVAHLELAPISVPLVARESVRTGWSIAAADGIILDISAQDGPDVHADSLRLQQVLDNLISNAVKFSVMGGRVEVRATHDDREWRIDVVDAGIGIPPAELDHLFDRFFRASNARGAHVPGTGLGLPTAKAITELHGGRLEVASAVGRGTTFTVYLPIVR